MVGMLVWKTPQTGKREKGLLIRERNVLHMRLVCAEILCGGKTPEAVVRRRVRLAVKRLQRMGIRQVVLPEHFPWKGLLEQGGIQPVSTVPLRQMLAADWVRWNLKERNIPAGGARVAILADRMTGAVVRTVTELALRHRYVMLKVSYGGEDLSSQLRREYGVTLLLNPNREQIESADCVVLFEKQAGEYGKRKICLYEEEAELPQLLLPPALEDYLPPGMDRPQMLTILMEAGILRPGQIAFQGRDF